MGFSKLVLKLILVGAIFGGVVVATDAVAQVHLGDLESVDLDKPNRRRPFRAALSGNEKLLLVANQKSGTVTVVDVVTMEVLGEWHVASSIGDLVHWQGNRFLLTGQRSPQEGRLRCLQLTDSGVIKSEWAKPTIGSPGKILIAPYSKGCFVGGVWSRQLNWLPFVDGAEPDNTVELPISKRTTFAIGNLTYIQNGEVVLATDKFGSEWATFRAEDLTPIQTGDMGSRRIAALAKQPDTKDDEARVVIVTQPLNRLAQAIRNDVHWGLMVANEVVMKDEASFVQSDHKESRRSSIPLGGPGEAKGDPESITYSPSGEVAIAIGGVNQVAIGDLHERSFAYVPTGARPVSSCFSRDGKRLYVVNQLDDSITVVDAENYEVVKTIPLGKMPEETEEDRGERLFFDAAVSHDGWMSCHSCHVEGHTSGFLNDNLSDQSFGAPKRILSLLGHGETAPFAWNGSAKTLEDQIRSSIEVTMQTDDEYSDEQIADLARFVKRLQRPPAAASFRYSAVTFPYRSFDREAGKALFTELGCAECHEAPSYTSSPLRNVGLKDELGKQDFNPPSLIGISQRQRFMHDARYSSLRELFADNKHQLKREISDEELTLLLDFLSTL